MSRVAKETDSKRLEELKKLISTAEYVNIAVEQIAWALSGAIQDIQDKDERRQG